MDGMNFSGRGLPCGRDTRAEDRAAVRHAWLMSAGALAATVAVVLGLAWAIPPSLTADAAARTIAAPWP